MPTHPTARRWLAPLSAAAIALLGACSQNADSPLAPRLTPGEPARLTSATPHIVISQIYGAGGNSGATLTNDYVELYNPGPNDVALTGWSVQYASTTGTSWQVTPLGGTIPAGHYYLVQESAGAGGSQALPTPDATGGIPMAAGAGKVALVNSTTPLVGGTAGVAPYSGASCLNSTATVVDFVGYGTGATCFLGTGTTPTISVSAAAFRNNGGLTDMDDNKADFSTGAPNPRNSGAQPVVTVTAAITPANTATPVGNPVTFTVTATSGGQPVTVTSATWSSSNPTVATIDASGVATAVAGGATTIKVDVITASGPASASTTLTVTNGLATSTTTVSEIHYDNVGTDAGEAMEIEGDAGSSLDGWSLVLYDGNGGKTYDSVPLSGTIPATCGARGVVVVTSFASGIQNGSPDGWALVNPQGLPVEFKSYEGTFAATNGPAAGLTSSAIDADESTAPPAGQSVQRARNGVWFGPVANTLGACNAATPPAPNGNVSITSGKTQLALGMQTQFFFGGTDLSGQKVTSVTWSSSDPSIITVDAKGIVTGKAVGSAQLVATAPDGATGSVAISIYLADGATSPIRLGHNTEFGEPRDANPSDDFLIRRAQYTVSYNPNRGGANWVSWNLDASHVGNVGRCSGTCYSADTVLSKAGLPAYTTADWVSNSTWDRGHMAPSADWTSSEADNNTTFFLSNFLPQAPDLNQGPWEVLEEALRDSVSAANGSREAYIIAGGIFTNGVGQGTLLNLGKIAIPDSTWKIAVITPAGTGINADGTLPQNTTVLAVNMPNVQGIRGNDWHQYVTTVAKIQQSTGYDFLALLAERTECRVEVRNCPPTARITGAQGGNEGQALAFDASTSSDPDAGTTLSYQWSIDGATAGIASTLSHTFADNGTYNVRLIVADQFGAADTTATNVTILNVAPTVSPLQNVTILRGETYTASGSFADPGADTWSATVDYGDGAGAGALALAGNAFTLSHQYTTAGVRTVTVSVGDGLASGGATATVTVLSADQGVPVLAGMVDALESAGTITHGEAQALGASIDAAAKSFANGNTTPAVNQLEAFVNKVGAMQQSGRLSAADADALVSYARRVIASV